MTPLATITPSANWVVEATTIALLREEPGVAPVFSRTPVPDGVPDAHDLPNMLRAAELLAHARPAAIVWNGSKGGLIGLEHDRALAEAITAETGIPAGTSALEIERVLYLIGARRVELPAPGGGVTTVNAAWYRAAEAAIDEALAAGVPRMS